MTFPFWGLVTTTVMHITPLATIMSMSTTQVQLELFSTFNISYSHHLWSSQSVWASLSRSYLILDISYISVIISRMPVNISYISYISDYIPHARVKEWCSLWSASLPLPSLPFPSDWLRPTSRRYQRGSTHSAFWLIVQIFIFVSYVWYEKYSQGVAYGHDFVGPFLHHSGPFGPFGFYANFYHKRQATSTKLTFKT